MKVLVAGGYDTAFFVTVVDGDEGVHCDRETVDSGWFRPQDLVNGDLSERFVAPPTWWTLRELAEMGDVDSVVAATSARDLRPIEPTLHKNEQGVWLVLPGHEEHHEAARRGFPSCIQMTPAGWEAVGV